jgi:hypothetical protein
VFSFECTRLPAGEGEPFLEDQRRGKGNLNVSGGDDLESKGLPFAVTPIYPPTDQDCLILARFQVPPFSLWLMVVVQLAGAPHSAHGHSIIS